jgi:hypothetical protein
LFSNCSVTYGTISAVNFKLEAKAGYYLDFY